MNEEVRQGQTAETRKKPSFLQSVFSKIKGATDYFKTGLEAGGWDIATIRAYKYEREKTGKAAYTISERRIRKYSGRTAVSEYAG